MERIRAALKAFFHPELLEIRDPLTGAMTKKEFLRISNNLLKRTRRSNGILSLVLLDIDGLKKINDTRGHKAGDEFIKRFAKTIFANIRPLDICVRWYGEGGDEFVLLLPEVCLKDAESMVLRIQREFPDFSWGSVGLAEYDNLETMLNRAEDLMYSRKNSKKL